VELPAPLSVFDYERLAQTKISHAAWDRISGGAADEITLRWNREAFDRMRLRPRVLVDVSTVDTCIRLLGHDLPFPILLAPVGAQGFVCPDGDLESARGAGAAGTIITISSSASHPVEEVMKAATGPAWFQLYVQRDRGFTRELVQRAESAGCRALCVTVDSPNHGVRNREDRTKGQLPERPLPNFKGKDYLDPSVTWRDIEWLRSFATTPVLLKGILNPEDAADAVAAGVDGIVVSNHGGRNLDTAPATLEVLPYVAGRVQRRIPVLLDGGVRRGTDVLKALALGAQAVLIGRPYLWGLAVNGSAGVASVVEILRKELAIAMALCGRPSISSIDESLWWKDLGW
jgi:4-hydroxymandelate oxidase